MNVFGTIHALLDGMLSLALSLLLASDILEMHAHLGLDTLPPPGQMNLVVGHQAGTSLPSLEAIDSVFIERGDGTGRRTTKHILNPDSIIIDNWTLVEEGFQNGLQHPDLTLLYTFFPHSTPYVTAFRREKRVNENRWVRGPVPGYDQLDIFPDTFTIRYDAQGREIERRTGDSLGWSESHTTEWNFKGELIREADYLNDTITFERLSSWNKGKRTYTRETTYGFPPGVWATERFGDTLEVSRCVACTDYSYGKSIQQKIRVDRVGNPVARWRVSDSLTVADTIFMAYDAKGRTARTWHSLVRNETWTNWDANGHQTSLNSRSPKQGRNGSDQITIDSSEWVQGRLVRTLSVYCDGDSTHRACISGNETTYTYATLTSVGIERGRTPEQAPRVLRSASTLAWIASFPDGSEVDLRTIDGRSLGSAIFRSGRANIHRPFHTGVFVWTINVAGSPPLSGTIMP